jgi:hypothetical protein
MPTFGGATEWVESDPPGPAELRGHVVLVNFWTLTCINWLPQEPYVRAWSQAYRDDSAPKEENLMSRTQQAHGEEVREAIAGRGRRWFDLRPEPRRRTDPMGLNSTWWMAVGWLIVILLVVSPFPWWW